MAALPNIVFDVNETLLDLETMEPVFLLTQIKAVPSPHAHDECENEQAMPITDIIVVCAIVSAFAIFAVALAWGDYQTREIARVSREPAAAGATVVALKRTTTTEAAKRGAQGKTTASAA